MLNRAGDDETVVRRPRGSIHIVAVFFSTLLLYFVTPEAFAANIPMEAIAAHVEGVANYISIKDGKSRRVEMGTGFSEGDKVITAGNGIVEIRFDTGDIMRMDTGTSMSIHSLHRTDNGSTFNIFSLWVGRVRNAVSRLATSESKFEYRTKAAIIGVAGSPDWIVETRIDPATGKDKTDVDFLGQPGDKGKLYVKGMEGTFINLTPGLRTDIFAGRPPAPPAEIPLQRRQNLEKATAIKAPKEEKKEEKKQEKKEEKKGKDKKGEQTSTSTGGDKKDEQKKDDKQAQGESGQQKGGQSDGGTGGKGTGDSSVPSTADTKGTKGTAATNVMAAPSTLATPSSIDQALVVNSLSQSVSTVIMPTAASSQTQATLGKQSTAVSSTISQTTTITTLSKPNSTTPAPTTPQPPAIPPTSTININIIPGR